MGLKAMMITLCCSHGISQCLNQLSTSKGNNFKYSRKSSNQLVMCLLQISGYYNKLKLETAPVAYFINCLNNSQLIPILFLWVFFKQCVNVIKCMETVSWELNIVWNEFKNSLLKLLILHRQQARTKETWAIYLQNCAAQQNSHQPCKAI